MKTDQKQIKQEKPTEELQNKKTVAAGAIIGGLLLGIFIGNVWRGKEKGELVINENTASTTEVASKASKQSASPVKAVEKNTAKKPITIETTPSTKENSVTLFSEQLAGKTVSIERAVLSQDGWLVVRENKNGEFGRILGAIWLPKGTTDSAVVELLRDTETGKDYSILIYSDNGDRQFSTEKDLPIKVGEKYVSKLFTAK